MSYCANVTLSIADKSTLLIKKIRLMGNVTSARLDKSEKTVVYSISNTQKYDVLTTKFWPSSHLPYLHGQPMW